MSRYNRAHFAGLHVAQEARRSPSALHEAWKTPAAAAAASKYGNTKTDGYDSKKEAKRATYLHALERKGEITNLREQVKYLLIPKYLNADGSCQERAAHYIADFVYENERGHTVVEDTKGFRTADYVLKRKLMLMVHGIKVAEV